MKRFASLFSIALTCLLALSCGKEGSEGSGSGKAILSVNVEGVEGLLEIPEGQIRTYEVAVTAAPAPGDALNITLGTDQALVDMYNAANGSSYEMLPNEAYELPADGLIFMPNNKKSTTGVLTLKATGCEQDKTYLLPIFVNTVKGTAQYDAPEDKAAYILFKVVAPQFDGSGTETDPYLIKDESNLSDMGYMLVSGKYTYFKMTADLDFKGESWKLSDSKGKGVFFEGDGHKISNVNAATPLFSSLEGAVKNVSFDNIVIDAGSVYAGVLAETAGYGTIVEKITVTNSSVTNTGCTGGLIGSIDGATISDCNVGCVVTGRMNVGGLLGRVLNGTLNNCHTTGNVTSNSYYAGGITGQLMLGTVTNCSAAGNVSMVGEDTYARIGGLIGEVHGGTLENCFATGDVASARYWGGGLVGVVNADEGDIVIKKCYAEGDLNFEKNEEHKQAGVGALVGSMSGGNVTIEDSFATGKVFSDRWSSGFVGNIYGGALVIKGGYSACDLSNLGPNRDGVYEDGIVIGARFGDDPAPTISVSGFVAWNTDNKAFCWPEGIVSVTGNYYGNSGTVSSQAETLGWSTEVWDLSGELPRLK